ECSRPQFPHRVRPGWRPPPRGPRAGRGGRRRGAWRDRSGGKDRELLAHGPRARARAGLASAMPPSDFPTTLSLVPTQCLLKERSAATRSVESRPIVVRFWVGPEARCYLISSRYRRARSSALEATHGAANMATHQHGDWRHRPGNLGELGGLCNHSVHRQSELLVNALIRRGLSKPFDSHDDALAYRDPAIPGLWRRSFNRDPRHPGRQHDLAVVLRLPGEVLEARHGDCTRLPAISLQPLVR